MYTTLMFIFTAFIQNDLQHSQASTNRPRCKNINPRIRHLKSIVYRIGADVSTVSSLVHSSNFIVKVDSVTQPFI